MTKNIKTTWDLSLLADGPDDPRLATWREEMKAAADDFIETWEKDEEYLQNPKVLRQALGDYEVFASKYLWAGREGYYFFLLFVLDMNNPEIKAKYNLVDEFMRKIDIQLHFFVLRIGKIAKDDQTRLLKSPELAPYKHFLERIFVQAEHQLSEAEEKILTLKSSVSYDKWVDMTEGFLAKEQKMVISDKGKREKVPFEVLFSLMKNRDKKIRDEAAKALNEILDKFIDVAEVEMNAILTNKKIEDELRGFTRPDQGRHLSDDIESSVVDAMIEAVAKNFSISRDFYRLKADLLGLKKLAYHERGMEYGMIGDEYSFDKACELVTKGFAKLDPQFAGIFQKFLENGQIDVYPKKGKRGGACCINLAKDYPTYVMLNHKKDLRSVTTLAHEMGHACNSELMRERQNALNFGTPLSIAEVASTFMEDFVLREIVKEVDDEKKLVLLVAKLDDAIASILRQVACYHFEQELHQSFREKGYLSKEEIGEIFRKHMSDYMGEAVEQSPGSQNWWVYWSHIRAFFYVYSYASGLLISKAMQNEVKKDPKFVKKVKEFLSAGTSQSPKEIFAQMGIDITDKKFWEKGLAEIRADLDEARALAKKLGKV